MASAFGVVVGVVADFTFMHRLVHQSTRMACVEGGGQREKLAGLIENRMDI